MTVPGMTFDLRAHTVQPWCLRVGLFPEKGQSGYNGSLASLLASQSSVLILYYCWSSACSVGACVCYAGTHIVYIYTLLSVWVTQGSCP